MFGWYRSQIKEHGALDATRLLWRAGWSKLRADLANRLLAPKVACPCCGWQGRRFYDYIELGYSIPNAACPQCDSHARHRAFHFWLRDEYDLGSKRGVALLFAPEKALAPAWEGAPHLQIFRADIEPTRHTDLLVDLQRLPIADDSVNLVWCHHVLEHIEDDRAAISELHRVLRPGAGELIVSVPMKLGTKTREYGFPDKRESGHWRIYGDDFADRLAESGLQAVAVDYEMSPEDRRRYGIISERFYVCRKAARPAASAPAAPTA